MAEDQNINQQLAARFKQLPEVVQKAITSADVQKHLRALADSHQLHLDQWEKLENEVMLALLGLQPVNDLQKNIQKEVGVAADVAAALASDISTTVFQPIRGELEHVLHAEVAAQQTPAASTQEGPKTPTAPATPPQSAPEGKATRAQIPDAYHGGQPSHERTSIDDDPYREPIA